MSFRVRLRTKNSSANDLKAMLRDVKTGVPFVVRLGSRTPIEQIFRRSHSRAIEINSIEGITNSRDKILMKRKFDEADVQSADWVLLSEAMSELTTEEGSDFCLPLIVKHKGSSKGKGIFLVDTIDELRELIDRIPNPDQYVAEKFHNYSKEYRLHVDRDGCFYTCRKMLKADAQDRWHRHDSNSVWILEDNPLFEKPINWESIVDECVKALHATGLTIGACDVKVQTEKGKPEGFVPKFIVMEINSAPAMGEMTTVKYFEKIKQIIEEYVNI